MQNSRVAGCLKLALDKLTILGRRRDPSGGQLGQFCS